MERDKYTRPMLQVIEVEDEASLRACSSDSCGDCSGYCDGFYCYQKGKGDSCPYEDCEYDTRPCPSDEHCSNDIYH